MTRNRWIQLGLAASLAVVAAACSGGGGSSPAPTVSASPGIAATTDVVGHNTCVLTAVAATPEDTGKLSCNQVASDARISGSLEATFRFADLPESNELLWGTNVITNETGTWDCQFLGIRSPNFYHAFDFSCHGRGGYDGLWAYYHQDGDVDYSAFSGWIEDRR